MTTDTLLISDNLAATERGDTVTLSGPGAAIVLTPADIDTRHRFANGAARIQRFPCPDPDSELQWTE